jgi:hypothetical protein
MGKDILLKTARLRVFGGANCLVIEMGSIRLERFGGANNQILRD